MKQKKEMKKANQKWQTILKKERVKILMVFPHELAMILLMMKVKKSYYEDSHVTEKEIIEVSCKHKNLTFISTFYLADKLAYGYATPLTIVEKGKETYIRMRYPIRDEAYDYLLTLFGKMVPEREK